VFHFCGWSAHERGGTKLQNKNEEGGFKKLKPTSHASQVGLHFSFAATTSIKYRRGRGVMTKKKRKQITSELHGTSCHITRTVNSHEKGEAAHNPACVCESREGRGKKTRYSRRETRDREIERTWTNGAGREAIKAKMFSDFSRRCRATARVLSDVVIASVRWDRIAD